MAKVITKTNNILEVKSFSKCMFMLALMALVNYIVFIVAKNVDQKWSDYAIVFFVCGVFMVIQKQRLTIFDKKKNVVVCRSVSVFKTKEKEFSFDEIKNVRMVYGSGDYARGGAIIMELSDDQHTMADSDICFGNRKRNERLAQEVNYWLDSNQTTSV